MEKRIKASRNISLFVLGFLTVVCAVADILISIKVTELSDVCECENKKNEIKNCHKCSGNIVFVYNIISIFTIYLIHIMTYNYYISMGNTVSYYRYGYLYMLIHFIIKVSITIYWVIQLGDEENGHINNYHDTVIYSILIMFFTTLLYPMLIILKLIGHYICDGVVSFYKSLKIVCCSQEESVEIEIELENIGPYEILPKRHTAHII